MGNENQPTRINAHIETWKKDRHPVEKRESKIVKEVKERMYNAKKKAENHHAPGF